MASNNLKELKIAKIKLTEEWKKYKMEELGLKKEMVSDELLSFCAKKGEEERVIEMNVIRLVRQLINMRMVDKIPQDLDTFNQETSLKYSNGAKIYF